MTTTAENRILLPDIAPSAFEHPWDRTALETLRKTPGLDVVFKKFASLGFERQVRLFFTADSLRLSPRQCPRVYELFRDAAQVLDMPEPELYLLQNPVPNAFAVGMDRFTIVVTSGLVDLLDDDELRAVIGHELGHIKSGHMLYRTMAYFLAMVGMVAARNLPFINMISQALIYAFYDWFRKSELTADRAGLLVAQNPDVSVSVLLKLAGGTHRDMGGLSTEEFLKQADDYEDMDSSFLNVLYKFEMTRFQTHPFPALRAREIRRWADTPEYRGILHGNYTKAKGAADARRCGKCGVLVENPTFAFCPECGAGL